MKRLLWALLGAIGAAIVLRFFAGRRMDTLYGEVSRLREVERKYAALLEKEAQREAAFVIPEADKKEFEERMANASPEKKMQIAMLDALYRDEARANQDTFLEDDAEDES